MLRQPLIGPSKGLRGKCVLSIEPLPSVPPADPLSIFAQHLHIVVHDLIAELSNALLLHTVDAVPALSCLVVTSHCKLYFTNEIPLQPGGKLHLRYFQLVLTVYHCPVFFSLCEEAGSSCCKLPFNATEEGQESGCSGRKSRNGISAAK